MFTLVVWVLFGWVAGTVAMWFMPPKQPVAGWQTVAVGVAGSIVGGMTSALVSGDYYAPGGILWSIIGAVAVVAAWRWYQEQP